MLSICVFALERDTVKSRIINTQMQRHIEAHEGIIIAPTSMVLECGGRSIQIDSDHDLYRNPCRFENWHHFHTKGKNQAGEHWEFDITNDDITKWFDK